VATWKNFTDRIAAGAKRVKDFWDATPTSPPTLLRGVPHTPHAQRVADGSQVTTGAIADLKPIPHTTAPPALPVATERDKVIFAIQARLARKMGDLDTKGFDGYQGKPGEPRPSLSAALVNPEVEFNVATASRHLHDDTIREASDVRMEKLRARDQALTTAFKDAAAAVMVDYATSGTTALWNPDVKKNVEALVQDTAVKLQKAFIKSISSDAQEMKPSDQDRLQTNTRFLSELVMNTVEDLGAAKSLTVNPHPSIDTEVDAVVANAPVLAGPAVTADFHP
jgi:hypothetical protein